ncbi:hypothetical protein CHS0354_009265 [Potamilus streckersoni]|uniref:Uncharacterized protein n=1 Tax=Potamilus streckersoni TaxID=2493646 RepID=A0AAE0SXZ4_9BIVA|nr:hypothetical protein CHS0354_009265 [Potamilus streckersoni]
MNHSLTVQAFLLTIGKSNKLKSANIYDRHVELRFLQFMSRPQSSSSDNNKQE